VTGGRGPAAQHARERRTCCPVRRPFPPCRLREPGRLVLKRDQSITEALRKNKLDQAIYFINRLVPTARLMHHRALAHFGLTNSDEFPQDLFDDQRSEAPKKKAEVEAPPPQSATADPVDVMLQSPLNAYAENFRILLKRPVLYEGDGETVFGPRRRQASATWPRACNFLNIRGARRARGTGAADRADTRPPSA
jgi:hypothetical protein